MVFAIRQAANVAGNSQGRPGDFFRRIDYRKGRSITDWIDARLTADSFHAKNINLKLSIR